MAGHFCLPTFSVWPVPRYMLLLDRASHRNNLKVNISTSMALAMSFPSLEVSNGEGGTIYLSTNLASLA